MMVDKCELCNKNGKLILPLQVTRISRFTEDNKKEYGLKYKRKYKCECGYRWLDVETKWQ